LIFQSSFENTRAFMVQQLEINKLNIDLIITNQDVEQGRAGLLQADQKTG
jgi:protein involved in ribonucleotide reduction